MMSELASASVNTSLPDLLQGRCPCLMLHQVVAPIDANVCLSECHRLEHTQQRRRLGHQSLKLCTIYLESIEVHFAYAASSCRSFCSFGAQQLQVACVKITLEIHYRASFLFAPLRILAHPATRLESAQHGVSIDT